MKHLAALLAALLFLQASVFSQRVQIDSLNKLLVSSQADTVRGRLLLHLSTQWLRLDPDSALYYSTEAHTLLEKANYKKGIADAVFQEGWVRTSIGQIPQAIALYKEAIDRYTELGEARMIAQVWSSLGVSHGMLENYTRALSYFLKALQYYEQHNDKKGLVSTNLRIGVVHSKTGNLDEALKYEKKALALALEIGDKNNAASLYNNIGSNYGQQGNYKQALHHLIQSKSIAESMGYWPIATEAYLNFGNVYRELNKADSSSLYFALAEQYFTKFKNDHGLALTYDGWAELLVKEGKLQAARHQINRSMEIANRLGNNSLLYNNYVLLLDVNKLENNTTGTIAVYEQLMSLKDTLYNAEKSAGIERLKAQYQQEKDELLIDGLRQDNLQKTRQRNLLLIVTIIGMLLLLAVLISVGFIYNKNVLLRRQRAELVELNKMKDKFLSILSHDLRSPLANVMQVLQVVNDHNQDEFTRPLFDKLKLTTGSVLETMDNMLAWGKNNFTKGVVNMAEIDLAAITERVCRLMKPLADNKHVTLTANIDQSLKVVGDEDQLEFVLRNLISNAIKFSKENDEIRIYSSYTNGKVNIMVQDEGMGMSDEQQATLFTFSDKESTKGTAGETGSGLGLVLSYEFIHQHKGELKVTSKEGNGTEFIISLPAA